MPIIIFFNFFRNGKPIWKHIQAQQHLFFDDYNYWVIASNYIRNGGSIASKFEGQVKIFGFQLSVTPKARLLLS